MEKIFYKVFIAIYSLNRKGDWKFDTSLALGVRTMDAARDQVSLLMADNPTRKFITTYEEYLFPPSEMCNNECVNCPLVESCVKDQKNV